MDATVNDITKGKSSLFKNRNFLFLFIGALFSSPGYYVYLIGAEWLMLTLNDNRFYFGMLFIAASIPRLLLLTVGGVVADRFNKRLILFLSDMTRALLILVLVVLLFADMVTAWHLIILAACFGISDAFSYPVLNSLTPMILEEEQLQRGNSFIQMTSQISPILGPALGGTLIAVLGFKGVFIAAFLFLFLASITVLLIRLEKDDDKEEVHSPWQDLKAGFVYARNNEIIMSIVFLGFILNFFFSGPLSMGIPIIVKDVFIGSAVSLATVETSLGIGALIGALVLASITLKKPGYVMVSGLIVLGILFTFIGFSSSVLFTAGLVAMMAFILQLVNIPLITMLQKTTDKKMLGRIMSLLMTVSTGLVPVSYVATSLLISAGVGIQSIIVCSGIIITLIALYNLRNKQLLKIRQ
ncbi:MFS transporter [Virgibacillus halodenitrificans]|uniref:MFS transporter n=1 Tax=Virgibacillus halodenitrificans TaxID=1482 RepID=A0AAC9IWU1_VIRHA|nr:MFS transporter [Virgibacillus halodenitrificans]APC47446.1 MFS transporter [Virgibacillus halodenitrificans]MBD1221730.1 MFS transporter [Virgibacillus halodenitrificans]MCG1029488.1 MFS transporter [Virgibacillus halodenitrificans]MCJ0932265.1 MFS transporter [Virgibacillus halodenitrificans]MEC2160717.1 MFS transporter [Virgibacillus halodenitrificans]